MKSEEIKIAYHFPDVRKVIEAGKGAQHEVFYRFADIRKTILTIMIHTRVMLFVSC
jgi:hypothetical protein